MLHVAPSSTAADAVPADPPPADSQSAARALIERQLAMLTRLAEIGMEIAEAAGRRARIGPADRTMALDARADGPSQGEPGLTFTRVARAVRLTIALQSRLSKELIASDKASAATRRTRIHRLVERAIEAEHDDDGEEIDRLSDEAWERLTDDEDDWDLLARPLAETVARICRDLGLSPDHGDWAFGIAAGETGASGALAAQGGDAPDPAGGADLRSRPDPAKADAAAPTLRTPRTAAGPVPSPPAPPPGLQNHQRGPPPPA